MFWKGPKQVDTKERLAALAERAQSDDAELRLAEALREYESSYYAKVSSAFDQNSCGMTSLYQVRFSSNATCAGTPGFFSSMTIIGNPFTKPTKSARQV